MTSRRELLQMKIMTTKNNISKIHRILSFVFAFALITLYANAELKVNRLNGSKPIITREMFWDIGVKSTGEGKNICTPSVIRIPNFVQAEDKAHPDAVYYLYFAHHRGEYIRMAWAVNLEGPWILFNVGDNDDGRVNGRGVLDLGQANMIGYRSDGAKVKDHIASPDVVIDEENKQFIMYFHGVSRSVGDPGPGSGRQQRTYVATSKSGLNFNNPDGEVLGGVGGGETSHGMKNAILGKAYFVTFKYNARLFAFSYGGYLWKAPNSDLPWETLNPKIMSWKKGPNPIYEDLIELHNITGVRHKTGSSDPNKGTPRHLAVHLRADGKTLEVWYTSSGDDPERIFQTTIDLSISGWKFWDSAITDLQTVHTEMLRAELDWEGANYPVTSSENELRDPSLFQDSDGKRYLFYSGGRELAIGIAEIIDNSIPQQAQKLPVMSKIDGSQITLELEDLSNVTSIKIVNYRENKYDAFIDLQYSQQGTEWTSLDNFVTTRNVLSEYIEIKFPSILYAKYIQFIANGNSDDIGNVYNEIETWGFPMTNNIDPCSDSIKFPWKGTKERKCEWLREKKNKVIKDICQKKKKSKFVWEWCSATCRRVGIGNCNTLNS